MTCNVLSRTLNPAQSCVYNQVFKQPWPGMMRTVYGNHERFETTYFKKFPGYYTTGDGKLHTTCIFICTMLATLVGMDISSRCVSVCPFVLSWCMFY